MRRFWVVFSVGCLSFVTSWAQQGESSVFKPLKIEEAQSVLQRVAPEVIEPHASSETQPGVQPSHLPPTPIIEQSAELTAAKPALEKTVKAVSRTPKFNSAASTPQLASVCETENDPRKKVAACGVLISRYATMEISTIPAEAQAQAQTLLELHRTHPHDDIYKSWLHESHQTIGRLALKNGNQRLALEQLQRSLQVPRTPQLQTVGPRIMLANELLEKGEKKRVLEYLDAVEKVWNIPSAMDQLKKWRAEIFAGKTMTL